MDTFNNEITFSIVRPTLNSRYLIVSRIENNDGLNVIETIIERRETQSTYEMMLMCTICLDWNPGPNRMHHIIF